MSKGLLTFKTMRPAIIDAYRREDGQPAYGAQAEGLLPVPIKSEPVKLAVKSWKPPKPQKRKKLKAWDRQRGICPYCDETMLSVEAATWDHIVPKSKGGSDVLTNKILVCSPCNSIKSNCSTFLEAAEKAAVAAQKTIVVQLAAFRLFALMKRLKDKGIIKE